MGEAAYTAKIARTAGKAVDAAKTASKGKKISNPVLKAKRVGNAMKLDAHHEFPDIAGVQSTAETPK